MKRLTVSVLWGLVLLVGCGLQSQDPTAADGCPSRRVDGFLVRVCDGQDLDMWADAVERSWSGVESAALGAGIVDEGTLNLFFTFTTPYVEIFNERFEVRPGVELAGCYHGYTEDNAPVRVYLAHDGQLPHASSLTHELVHLVEHRAGYPAEAANSSEHFLYPEFANATIEAVDRELYLTDYSPN